MVPPIHLGAWSMALMPFELLYFFFCLIHAQGSLCPCIGYRRLLRSTSHLRGERSLPMEGERESPLLSLLGPLRLREPWLSLLTSRCLSLSHTHTAYIIHTHSHTQTYVHTHSLSTYIFLKHPHTLILSLTHTNTHKHICTIFLFLKLIHIHCTYTHSTIHTYTHSSSIGGRESDHRWQWYWYPAIRWQCQIRSRVRLTHTQREVMQYIHHVTNVVHVFILC